MIEPTRVILVYQDEEGNHHEQPVSDLTESGTLIDPETGDDMPIVGVKISA